MRLLEGFDGAGAYVRYAKYSSNVDSPDSICCNSEIMCPARTAEGGGGERTMTQIGREWRLGLVSRPHFLCDWRWRSSYFVRSLALRAHSVLSLSWHGVQWRTFRPRGIWREPTLWPKMAAGAPQRPPLTSWRSFPEGARWRPCRIFVGVDCVVRRSTRALCTCTDISVSIYIYTHIVRQLTECR